MKVLPAIVLILTATTAYAISQGAYSISELTVRDAPTTKPSGDYWDYLNNPMDLYVELYLSNYGNDYLQKTWGTKQDSGTSATWSSTCELLLTRDLTEGEQAFIAFYIGDDDPDADDLVDSGRIRIQDLELGDNEIACYYGTEISFVLERVYEEDYEADYEDGFDYVNTIRPSIVESVGETARTRLLRNSDLEDLSYREIKLVRNYIYACYDRSFAVEWIRDYFLDNMRGYSGDGPENPSLTTTESANISFVQEYERDNDIPVINN